MTEKELWEWMMDGNYPKGWPEVRREHRAAIATLSKDIVMKKWQGHGENDLHVPMKKGDKVKVVMASRFGDVGITDDLSAENGYHYRTTCVREDDKPGDGLLVDIQPVYREQNI